jgi:hypothetical protein
MAASLRPIVALLQEETGHPVFLQGSFLATWNDPKYQFISLTLLQKGLNATFVSRKWDKVEINASNICSLPITMTIKPSKWKRIIYIF